METLIKSIDYFSDGQKTVELVIVLNQPTEELKALVIMLERDFGTRFIFNVVTIEQCNLGVAYNMGLKHAKYDHVLFLDSDLTCHENGIEQIIAHYRKFEPHIIKAKVTFEYQDTCIGRAIYEARTASTTEIKMPYIPVIFMRKDIFNVINDGYMFAQDTVWCSDADFAKRVLAKQLQVDYLNVYFSHPRIGLKKDLKDAFFYGLGKGIRVRRTKESWSVIQDIKDTMTIPEGFHISNSGKVYLCLWCFLLQAGCAIQQLLPNHSILKQSIEFDD